MTRYPSTVSPFFHAAVGSVIRTKLSHPANFNHLAIPCQTNKLILDNFFRHVSRQIPAPCLSFGTTTHVIGISAWYRIHLKSARSCNPRPDILISGDCSLSTAEPSPRHRSASQNAHHTTSAPPCPVCENGQCWPQRTMDSTQQLPNGSAPLRENHTNRANTLSPIDSPFLAPKKKPTRERIGLCSITESVRHLCNPNSTQHLLKSSQSPLNPLI